MSAHPGSPAGRMDLRPLSKQEIDRCVESVVAEVARPANTAEVEPNGSQPLRPRWITPGEMVRRMRRFLVPN